MTLPALFVSGPIAGYLLGHFVLHKYFKAPALVVPIFVGIGFAASAIQIFRLIKKIKQFDNQDPQNHE